MDLAKKAAVVVSVGVLVLLVVLGAAYARDVLLWVFAGVLFSIFLRGLSDFISKYTPLGEKWSLVVTVLLFLAMVVAIGWLLVPSIASQTDQLRQSIPKSVEQLQDRVKQYEWGRWMLEKAPDSDELLPRRRDLFSSITGVVSGTVEAVGVVFVIFFTGLYLAIQPRLYIDGIAKLVSIPKRDRAKEVLGKVGSALKWWLLGKLVSMTFVGVLTWFGLMLLGIDIALTLAVLAAVLTFIPNFGPIISAVPAVLLGLLDSPMTAVWVVVLYLGIQTVESYMLTPLIQQKTVSLPPALTITAQLLMATFAGVFGLAVATPLTVVMLVLVQSLYVHDMLGDEPDGFENGF